MISPMTYTSEPINLWEALTTLETNHRREQCARGPRVTEQDIRALSDSGRWNGQELNIRATDEGWLIKIFSCYDDHREHDSVEIMIPMDRHKPVRILKDCVGRIAFRHD